MSDKVKYTKKYLLNLLKENNIKETSKKIIALVTLAIEHGLVKKESVLSDTYIKKPRGRPRICPIVIKEKKIRVKKEKVKKDRKKVGRPRIYPLKEKKERHPKYDRLLKVRTDPVSIKITNIETGEEIIYKSLYNFIKKTGHGCRYIVLRHGKTENGFKYELINLSKFPKESEK